MNESPQPDSTFGTLITQFQASKIGAPNETAYQKWLGNKLGVTPKTIRDWANGTKPREAALVKLYTFLDGLGSNGHVWKTAFQLAAAKLTPADFPAVSIDISLLPATYSIRWMDDSQQNPASSVQTEQLFVGRAAVLDEIDGIYNEKSTRVLNIWNPGGYGKTAVAKAWATRLSQSNINRSTSIYAYSFYALNKTDRTSSPRDFFSKLIKFLNVEIPVSDTEECAEQIAKKIVNQNITLIIDGAETLQYGPGPMYGHYESYLFKRFIRYILQSRSATCFILITSRLRAVELDKYSETSINYKLPKMDITSSCKFLKLLGVKGSDKILNDICMEYDCQPLALLLYAHYVVHSRDGNPVELSQSNVIMDQLVGDVNAPDVQHAHRVLESYWLDWVKTDSLLRSIMFAISIDDQAVPEYIILDIINKNIFTDYLLHEQNADYSSKSRLFQLVQNGIVHKSNNSLDVYYELHPLMQEFFYKLAKKLVPDSLKNAHKFAYHFFDNRVSTRYAENEDDVRYLIRAIFHGVGCGKASRCLDYIYKVRLQRYEGTQQERLRKAPWLRKFLRAQSLELGIFSNFVKWIEFDFHLRTNSVEIYKEFGFLLFVNGYCRDAEKYAYLAEREAKRGGPAQSTEFMLAKQNRLQSLLIRGCFRDVIAEWRQENIKNIIESEKENANSRIIRPLIAIQTYASYSLWCIGKDIESTAEFDFADNAQKIVTPEVPRLFAFNGFWFNLVCFEEGNFEKVI
jgi:AAA domain